MIYSFSITTPKSTVEANKAKTELKLTGGIIHQVDILFPTGCMGYAYIAINDGLHQLWPTNPDEYFHTDGETISFEEFYDLKYGPHVLTAYTYNLDEKYPHTIIVRLGVLRMGELKGVWFPWSGEELG